MPLKSKARAALPQRNRPVFDPELLLNYISTGYKPRQVELDRSYY